jgi:hypothetical protein
MIVMNHCFFVSKVLQISTFILPGISNLQDIRQDIRPAPSL